MEWGRRFTTSSVPVHGGTWLGGFTQGTRDTILLSYGFWLCSELPWELSRPTAWAMDAAALYPRNNTALQARTSPINTPLSSNEPAGQLLSASSAP